MKKIFFAFTFLLLIFWSSNAQKSFTVGFYNVENLFDTIDQKQVNDAEYTPEGKLKWNSERYFTKLDHLSKVISELGNNNGPDVLGLAEVENARVLKNLTEMPLLKTEGYNIVHYESPDERGIDVALLFKSKTIKLISSDKIRIQFPDDPKDKTRDILLVSLLKDKKDTIWFLVNHFPSRKGGTEISEPKRIYVAQQARKMVDSLLKQNYQSKIILMGDFNDEPQDRCIRETLKCQYKKNEVSWNELYNPMMDLKEQGKGTIMYRKNYELIDQFMLSAALLSENNKLHYIMNSATIYMPEYIVEQTEAYKGSPLRTYAGMKYLGGYSDHFPVFMKISY